VDVYHQSVKVVNHATSVQIVYGKIVAVGVLTVTQLLQHIHEKARSFLSVH